MRRFALVFGLFLIGFSGAARAEPQWLTLPPTPSLPAPAKSSYAPVNGIKIWYATFGHGPPVILLHGGLANADYWGKLVPDLLARALPRHRHGQPRPRPQLARRAALRLRSDGVRRARR